MRKNTLYFPDLLCFIICWALSFYDRAYVGPCLRQKACNLDVPPMTRFWSIGHHMTENRHMSCLNEYLKLNCIIIIYVLSWLAKLSYKWGDLYFTFTIWWQRENPRSKARRPCSHHHFQAYEHVIIIYVRGRERREVTADLHVIISPRTDNAAAEPCNRTWFN